MLCRLHWSRTECSNREIILATLISWLIRHSLQFSSFSTLKSQISHFFTFTFKHCFYLQLHAFEKKLHRVILEQKNTRTYSVTCIELSGAFLHYSPNCWVVALPAIYINIYKKSTSIWWKYKSWKISAKSRCLSVRRELPGHLSPARHLKWPPLRAALLHKTTNKTNKQTKTKHAGPEAQTTLQMILSFSDLPEWAGFVYMRQFKQRLCVY